MSATITRQGGGVQLQQCDMRLALNMAKTAKGENSCTARQVTHMLRQNPRANVRDEKKHVLDFSGHEEVKTVPERHPAIDRENHIDS